MFFSRPKEPLGVKLLPAQQYSMCYKVPKAHELASATNKLGHLSDKMHAVVGGQDSNIPKADRMLPVAFRATDGTLRVLRTKPVVVDTTRFTSANEHNRLYSDLLLFKPWFDEQEDLGIACGDFAVCSDIYEANIEQINAVKEGCKNFFLDHL